MSSRPALRQWEPWSKLQRPAGGRALAGVAECLARKFEVSLWAVRTGFVFLAFCGGVGIAVYMAAWLVLPPEGESKAIWANAVADKRTIALTAGVATLLAAVTGILFGLGEPMVIGSVSPGWVSAAALVGVWRHPGTDDRLALVRVARLLDASKEGLPTRRRLVLSGVRVLVGLGLLGAGALTFLSPRHLTHADMTVGLAAIGVMGGMSLVLAPWWLRLGRDLSEERRQRLRAEERAEMASHLHDSVLQTLALIQRSAAEPLQVQKLARAQERQLRSWLFEQQADGAPALAAPTTVSQALVAIQQEVEADHGSKVEVVTVGDAPLDDRLRAVVAAAREAVVNSAKWSGADAVSLFAEVEPDLVSIFVRDRGCGFDLDAVAPDRKGVSQSIKARTRRHGGTATVRTSPGEGTEVSLKMPRRR
ncbi:MAG TPA: PspC domain-containing protein [Acidimicrobiales bacterium]|nr:PspC domain-containing protein [Acidimicrobiales bacterium]